MKTKILTNKIKRQKALEKELDCNFIRISSHEKDFDRFIDIRKVSNHINESFVKLSENSLIYKILKRLLDLEI